MANRWCQTAVIAVDGPICTQQVLNHSHLARAIVPISIVVLTIAATAPTSPLLAGTAEVDRSYMVSPRRIAKPAAASTEAE